MDSETPAPRVFSDRWPDEASYLAWKANHGRLEGDDLARMDYLRDQGVEFPFGEYAFEYLPDHAYVGRAAALLQDMVKQGRFAP